MIFPPTIRLFLVPCLGRDRTGNWLQAYTEQPGSRTIYLDPRTRFNMVRLLIHEVLHVQHPSWSESKVILEARKRFNKMTWKGKANLLQSAFARAHVGWPDKEDENE